MSRLARLAAVGVRSGVGLLGQRGEGAAEYAAAVLGNLRGLASKIGQTLSYVDGLIQPLKKAMWSKDGSFVMLPPPLLLLNRLQFGFYSVLARLDVRAAYAEVERRFMQDAGLFREQT